MVGGTRTELNGSKLSTGKGWDSATKTPKLLLSKSNSIDIEFKSDGSQGRVDTLVMYFQSVEQKLAFI